MSGDKKIRVGSRKSELALIQTRHVISLLGKLYPEKEFEIITMSTLGDKVLDIPLPKIGEKSLFTKELETALVTGCVDFVVHSLKDLPTALPEGLAIGAVLKREDPRDALVVQKDLTYTTLDSLPKGSTIGTSSLRRTAQLARNYPHLRVENIRGNLNTRLRKLDELGQFQAIILAAAGLNRMGWDERISQIFENKDLLYAVGQGALAVECRESDKETIKLLSALYDQETAVRILAERSFLKTLGGGCSAPVAVWTEIAKTEGNKYKINITGAVWSLDGKEEIMDNQEIEVEVKHTRRCAECPYANKKDDSCAANCMGDIECLTTPPKKPKINEPSKDLLKNHPLEHMDIPIGMDFMGKCPYLEGDLTKDNMTNTAAIDITKCPFHKDAKVQIQLDFNNSIPSVSKAAKECSDKENNLYCGLVEHADLPVETMVNALKLGEKLANSLMKEGACEVMAKAQAHIRGSI